MKARQAACTMHKTIVTGCWWLALGNRAEQSSAEQGRFTADGAGTETRSRAERDVGPACMPQRASVPTRAVEASRRLNDYACSGCHTQRRPAFKVPRATSGGRALQGIPTVRQPSSHSVLLMNLFDIAPLAGWMMDSSGSGSGSATRAATLTSLSLTERCRRAE